MKQGYIQNIIGYMLVCLSLVFGATSCDIHEFPEIPEKVQVNLNLNFEISATGITEWNHIYDDNGVTEQGFGDIYDNTHSQVYIRYIIRTYPVQGNNQNYTQEFIIKKNIADGYSHSVALDIAPGDYDIMVWADMVEDSTDAPFYNADNFSEIFLEGVHQGCNEYRDAFRGTTRISLVASIIEQETKTIEVQLQRPLAKYEFVTTGLTDFIKKEQLRIEAINAAKADNSKNISIDDYRVVFHYVGFMPNTYSMFTDKPVDSSTGVQFDSELQKISDTEASMGFDYVFVNGTESAVTVQIGIYDSSGTQVSLTDPINVPLRRNHHTIMRGSFLLMNASGGVTIDPGFDGDYNLVFP